MCAQNSLIWPCHSFTDLICACSTNHAELSIIFAAPSHIPFLLAHSEKYPTLKTVVSLEVLDDDEKRVLTAWAKTKGLKFMDIEDMEEYGRAHLSEVITPTFDTPATICYTSVSDSSVG